MPFEKKDRFDRMAQRLLDMGVKIPDMRVKRKEMLEKMMEEMEDENAKERILDARNKRKRIDEEIQRNQLTIPGLLG